MDTFEAAMKRSISLTAIVRITRAEPPVGKHVTKRRFIRKYLFCSIAPSRTSGRMRYAPTVSGEKLSQTDAIHHRFPNEQIVNM